MLELLYATGMRVSEMLHLQIFDVNLQFGYVVCNENGKERIILLVFHARRQWNGICKQPELFL